MTTNNKTSRLVVLCGPPCSGKSNAAEGLELHNRLPRLEMDAFRSQIFPLGNQTPEERQASYNAMHICAGHLLRWGIERVCLVATYQPFVQREAVARLAQNHEWLRVIQFMIDPEIAVRRFLEGRDDHPAKDLTPERVHQQARSYKYYHRAPIIDAGRLNKAQALLVTQQALEIREGEIPGPVPTTRFAEWIDLVREVPK